VAEEVEPTCEYCLNVIDRAKDKFKVLSHATPERIAHLECYNKHGDEVSAIPRHPYEKLPSQSSPSPRRESPTDATSAVILRRTSALALVGWHLMAPLRVVTHSNLPCSLGSAAALLNASGCIGGRSGRFSASNSAIVAIWSFRNLPPLLVSQ
jgi:hypothetical protein